MRGINGEQTALARSREIHLNASPRKAEEQRVGVHLAGRGTAIRIAPGRLVVAMSRGTRETATSTPVRSLVYFRRMNDNTPAKVFSLTERRHSNRPYT